jgi:hypothetical protein
MLFDESDLMRQAIHYSILAKCVEGILTVVRYQNFLIGGAPELFHIQSQ